MEVSCHRRPALESNHSWNLAKVYGPELLTLTRFDPYGLPVGSYPAPDSLMIEWDDLDRMSIFKKASKKLVKSVFYGRNAKTYPLHTPLRHP